MTTQKAISAKINLELLQRLDDALRSSSRYGANRNDAINKALDIYLQVIRIEEDPEGMTQENQQRLASYAHRVYSRWKY